MTTKCIHPRPFVIRLQTPFLAFIWPIFQNESEYTFAIDPQMDHFPHGKKNFINLLKKLKLKSTTNSNDEKNSEMF